MGRDKRLLDDFQRISNPINVDSQALIFWPVVTPTSAGGGFPVPGLQNGIESLVDQGLQDGLVEDQSIPSQLGSSVIKEPNHFRETLTFKG